MDEISMEIEKLLDAVHRSDEYQEYQKQAAQLEADPELKARVMRFRGDNFRLQNHSDKDELFHIAKEHSTKDIRNYCVSYYSITEEELQDRKSVV